MSVALTPASAMHALALSNSSAQEANTAMLAQFQNMIQKIEGVVHKQTTLINTLQTENAHLRAALEQQKSLADSKETALLDLVSALNGRIQSLETVLSALEARIPSLTGRIARLEAPRTIGQLIRGI